ncbi:MAG: ATP phosphoribosyltransferase regulatory subunit, partial [bacterium]|nr:ATP phosphoribosyltransferase regulatory subunit [bacterium]
VQVNSIGCSSCRPYFKKTLAFHLKKFSNSLCVNCKSRLKKNPLRILDCKEEKCERVKKSCPQILDHLCKGCHDHFKALLEFLEPAGIPFSLNPSLVRGLDYYTKTVFEIVQESAKGQGSLAGGGRYDDLVKLLGGKPTPACGAAIGLDRVANLLKEGQEKKEKQERADVFLAQVGDLAKQKSLILLENFRQANIDLAQTLSKDSLSIQLKTASKLEAKFSLIFGHQEALKDEIIVREMSSGRQKTIALDKAVQEIKKRLK